MLLSPMPGPAYIKAVPPPLMVATTVTTFAAAAAGWDAIIATANEIAGTRCRNLRNGLFSSPPWRTRGWPRPFESHRRRRFIRPNWQPEVGAGIAATQRLVKLLLTA